MHRLGELIRSYASHVARFFLLEIFIMTKSFNRVAVYAVFNDADNVSASLAERLFALGIASRSEARPLAMEWAIEDTKRKAIKAGKPVPTVKLIKGQRGLTFSVRDSAAERACNRVLEVCFPSADKPKSAKPTVNKVDAVDALLKKYKALTASEKRRFLKSI